jgi:hypothetical protein
MAHELHRHSLSIISIEFINSWSLHPIKESHKKEISRVFPTDTNKMKMIWIDSAGQFRQVLI